jgi:luciferase family oxidoreductase group 1
MKKIRLSILDQSPVKKGSSAEEAVRQTIELAQKAEQWGYHRFWFSEHHNITTIAGSAPEILAAYLAAVTKKIRLGSGGVMLPNHSSLKVAENFRMLETLAPGRIDLGIGRAPGGDRLTAALLNPSNRFKEQDYIQQIEDLKNFFNDTMNTEYGQIKAIPMASNEPPIWMLTSSGSSAYIAAEKGLGLAFAKFIVAQGAAQAVKIYKDLFKPSDVFSEPEALVAIWVMCADTEEKANQMRMAMLHIFLQLETGRISDGIPSYDEIKNYVYSPEEKIRMEANSARMITGTALQVKKQIEQLADECDVEEIMAVTITFSYEDKIRSFELLAETFGLQKRDPTAFKEER